MSKCININLPEYKSLAKAFKGGQRELKARIATWQELNDTDQFPSLEEVEGLIGLRDSLILQGSRDYFKNQEAKEQALLESKFPTENVDELKKALDNSFVQDVEGGLTRLRESYNVLYAANPMNMDVNEKAVFTLWQSTLNNTEKENLSQALNTPTFSTLASYFNEYVLTGSVEHPQSAVIENTFKRFMSLGEALNNNLQGSREYYHAKVVDLFDERELKQDNDIKIRRAFGKKGTQVYSTEQEADRAAKNILTQLNDKTLIHRFTNTKGEFIVRINMPNVNNYAQRDIPFKNRQEYETNEANESTIQVFIKDVLGGISNAPVIMEADTVLSAMLKSENLNLNTSKRNVLTTIQSNLKDYPIQITMLPQDYVRGEVLGSYKDDVVTLGRKGFSYETLAHELIHAVSENYLEAQLKLKESERSEAFNTLMKVYTQASKKYTQDDYYGMKDIHEFLSEIFTDGSLRMGLRNLRVESGKSALREFLDTILEWLGFKQGTSVYPEAMAAAIDILEYGRVDTITPMRIERSKLSSKPSRAERMAKLQDIYSMQDIKELSQSITTMFMDVLSEYHEHGVGMDGQPLQNKTRKEVLREITPPVIFNDILTDLKSLREVYESHLGTQSDPVLKKELLNYIQNINKLLVNFDDMLLYSALEIGFMEEINFNFNDYSFTKKNIKNELDNGVSPETDLNEGFITDRETAVLEGWQSNFKNSSVGSSLTMKVKKALRNVDMLIDGNPVYDSIGMTKKLNMEVVKNQLLLTTKDMITSKDMLPLLEKMSKEKLWVTGIIDQLQSDDELFSQFYQVFRKDFVKFSITLPFRNSDGTNTYKTIFINESDSLNLHLEDWRGVLERNETLVNKPIYNTQGEFIESRITEAIKGITDLNKSIKELKRHGTTEKKKDFTLSNTNKIHNLLKLTGITITHEELSGLLESFYAPQTGVEALQQFTIDKLLDNTLKTLTWASKNLDKHAVDLMKENRGNYSNLAKIFTAQLGTMIEAAVHQNGKSYYTYLQPSYLTKLVKQLKGLQRTSKEYQDFIETEFKQYEGTLYNSDIGTFNIAWLNQLTEASNKYRDMFDHKVLLSYGNIDYSALSSVDYTMSLLTEYFSNKDYAWYHVPILAEAPSAEFIKFEKITTPDYKSIIAEKLLDTFKYEWGRMRIVNARKNLDVDPIKHFDKNGDKFVFLSFLNEYKSEIEKRLSNDNINSQGFKEWLKGIIIENLDQKANESLMYLKEVGVLEQTGKNFILLKGLDINTDNMQDKLHEYFYNSYLATTNIIQLTNTDLAYYKNIEDFQKRNKQLHAPGILLNTQATYNGQRIGKDVETSVYIADDEAKSTQSTLRGIQKVIVLDNNKLSVLDKANIISKYGDSNSIMKGNMLHITSEHPLLPNIQPGYYILEKGELIVSDETTYNNNEGRERLMLTVNHANMITNVPTFYNNITDGQGFRTLKSYKEVIAMSQGWNDTLEETYQRLSKGEWDMKDWNIIFQAIKPYMYSQVTKNSGLEGQPIKVPVQHKNSESLLLPVIGMQFNSPKLRGIMEAMDKNNIDVLQFDSVVKVGLQGAININHLNTRKQIVDEISSHRNNPNVFHKFSYEDYKIQQPVPEHLQDTEQLFGTQLRKLITADISTDAIFTVQDKQFNKEELVKLYNDTIIENIIESYKKVSDRFANPKALQQAIEEELHANERYSRDLINACQLDANGNFVLPLYDPAQSIRIQQLLNSIWKNSVTKQKIKGGMAVQMSAFGLSDTLEIKFKEDGGIDYIEAYLPWWSDQKIDDWQDYGFIDDRGIMDAQRMVSMGIIDESMLDIIGYRIPTEDKYSMLPIRVKGFLPRNAGGNIMLPNEITTITGSDFDVDKIYLMLKEFQLLKDEFGAKNKFKTIEYDINKDPQKMNKSERDNLLIDIIRSVLTNKDTTEKQLNPGNFDGPKKTARILNALASGSELSLEQLESMSLDELDKLSAKNKMDIASFTTQVYLHKQNMTAAALIGIVANHSVNHALRQYTEVSVTDKEIQYRDKDGNKVVKEVPRFILNGVTRKSLHDMFVQNSDGTQTYISKNFASYLAASVDAVKDPVLAYFNLNTFTADSAMMLTGLGYSFNEVGFLLRQPAIEAVVDYYNKFRNTGINKANAIEGVIREYKKILLSQLGTTYKRNYNNKLTLNSLADNIRLSNKVKQLDLLEGKELQQFLLNNRGELIGYFNEQLDILYNYSEILDIAQKLADLVASMRSDTGNGGAGPTIAHTLFKLKRVETNYNNAVPVVGKPILNNSDLVKLNINSDNPDLREELRNSPVGFVQAFTTLGLQGVQNSLEKYFPQNKDYFKYIIDVIELGLKSSRMSADMMNNIITEFYSYYMSQYDFFNRESQIDTESFIKDFPTKFSNVVKDHPELQDLTFIKNLKVVRPTNEVPMYKLKFVSGGRLSNATRDEIINEWESMLYGDPVVKQLAMDLFKYTYFVNGFGFGATSFAHLAPTALKLEIPEYVEGLYQLMNAERSQKDTSLTFSKETLDTFIDQYYRNHLGDRRLVPQVALDDSVFEDEKGNVKDYLEITVSREELLEFITQGGEKVRYIYKQHSTGDHYFKIENIVMEENESTIVILSRAKPLGIRNNFLEYSFQNNILESEISDEDYASVSDRVDNSWVGSMIGLNPEAYAYEYNAEDFMQQVDIQATIEAFQKNFETPSMNEESQNRFEQAIEYRDLKFDFNAVLNNYANITGEEIGDLTSAITQSVEEKIEEAKKKCNG